ncbi:MAG TPA: glycosyltransferase family 4 protein [Terriglobia bacterium]|nr:glycosyltransferase family 4 protein [Terriglobia bacterium]
MVANVAQPKLLYVLPRWFTLGHTLRGQLGYLRRQGMTIDVVSEDDPRAWLASKREGVKLFPLQIEQRPSAWQDLRALVHLLRLMRENRYDIVNGHTKKGAFLTAIAAKLARVPSVVYSCFGITSSGLHADNQAYFTRIERYICWLSTKVILLSQSNRQYFVSKRICPDSKCTVIANGSANGVDCDYYKRTNISDDESSRLRANLGIELSSFVLGFVGRLVPGKGIFELGEAWKILRLKHERIHLVVAAPPEMDNTVTSVIKSMQADQRCHFLGFLDDPRPAYSMMDCLVFPTHGEGFGNVVIEAAAMGVPAIVSNSLGAVETVVHDETGLLIAPRDSGSIVAAVSGLMENANRVHVLGENARRRCVALFRSDMVWEGVVKFYEDLVSSTARKSSHNISEEFSL